MHSMKAGAAQLEEKTCHKTEVARADNIEAIPAAVRVEINSNFHRLGNCVTRPLDNFDQCLCVFESIEMICGITSIFFSPPIVPYEQNYHSNNVHATLTL